MPLNVTLLSQYHTLCMIFSDVFSFYVIFEITKLLKVIFSGCQALRLYFVLTYILRSVPRVNRMLYALLSLRDV